MAQAVVSRETLDCPICLALLKDPVTVSCGHSFCMRCLQQHWDNQTIYRCPQCQTTFRLRPDLGKNIMLAELVEELKNSGLQEAPADHCYAGAEDVPCDFCSGRKLKALKSCLVCLASFCHQHLQPHYDSAAFKRHKLVDPSHQLQENICSRHSELMNLFCRTDQQCICSLCWLDEHKGHNTVSAAAERVDKQKELEVSQQEVQQRIRNGEKNMKDLQEEENTINVSADKAVEHSEKIFTDLIRELEKRRRDVTQQIRSQQEAEVSRVKELQEKMEQEIAELRRTDDELQQLSHTDDHTHFLRRYSSLPRLSRSTSTSSLHVRPLRYFTHLMDAVSQTRDKLMDTLKDTWTNISQAPVSEPRTRDELLQFYCDLTLDPNTVNRCLVLSEGNRRVTRTDQLQMYPDHSDRFTDNYQVLSSQSLTGRCYWEVELTGDVIVAVTYKTISRAGGRKECWFGLNDQSWSLYCLSSGCTFWFNDVRSVNSGSRPSRVGVFLDHRAGVLSFYSVCGTTRLLHRVQTTFTQPLYAGICVCPESTAELLKMNE
ncbi:tripartite motif-containing protein 16-like [Lampetra planeri]